MKITKEKNQPKKQEITTGFLGGLNVFQDETLIKDSELTEARNILLNVDGVSPRYGSTNYGSESGDNIVGSIAYYKSDGTRELIRIASGTNDKLQKMVNGTPTDIGSNTYDTTVDMNFVQADDKIWTFNGVNALTYYNGSTITTYASVSTPAGLSVTATGTTGSTHYSYRISAFNDVGETVACTSVAITNGNATLNATNYNALAWTATTGATGYNIYGRTATGLGEMYMDTVYTNSYKDQGQVSSPSTSILPPTANTTTGIIGKYPIFAISRVFVAGIKDNPSRLIFSGTGQKVGDFSTPDFGAGGVDVFKNDGADITGIIPFQGGVIVFKSNAIYKFSFTSDGYQQLEEITKGFGAISFRSIKHVENDVIFLAKKDGRMAFYSLGNQENYVATVLRTNELSIKVAPRLSDANLDELDGSTAHYYRNLYMCAIPTSNSDTNNRIWVLDTRFGAWVYWDDLNPNCFVEFFDSSGDEKLYYGSETTGYLIEMFVSDRNDNGTAISVKWATKAFNQGQFSREKRYYMPTVLTKDVENTSTLDCYIYTDGHETYAPLALTQLTLGGGGVGAILPGFTIPGDTPGLVQSDSDVPNDTPIEIRKQFRARSIKYMFESDTKDAEWKVLAIAHVYAILRTRLTGSHVVYTN